MPEFMPCWQTTPDADFAAAYRTRREQTGKKGYGIFARYHVFTLEDGHLVPVQCPDPQRLSELPGYEREREKIIANAAKILNCVSEELVFDGKKVSCPANGREVSLAEIGVQSMCANNQALQVTESHYSPVSPPPFMVGMVEIELDKETGQIDILDYVAVVDCGTPLNPNLARVQVEGGIAQGIGMALYENVQYTDTGRLMNNSFMQYKIPSRLDVGKLRVEFESSYEETGPFGAKSIGEIVINTPSPALAHAVANATGRWIKELPITGEKIVMGAS